MQLFGAISPLTGDDTDIFGAVKKEQEEREEEIEEIHYFTFDVDDDDEDDKEDIKRLNQGKIY